MQVSSFQYLVFIHYLVFIFSKVCFLSHALIAYFSSKVLSCTAAWSLRLHCLNVTHPSCQSPIQSLRIAFWFSFLRRVSSELHCCFISLLIQNCTKRPFLVEKMFSLNSQRESSCHGAVTRGSCVSLFRWETSSCRYLAKLAERNLISKYS